MAQLCSLALRRTNHMLTGKNVDISLCILVYKVERLSRAEPYTNGGMMALKQNGSCHAGLIPPDVETIYQTLRTDIIRMRLRPGERLSEKELGLRFGTSRTPVREAIVRLVDDGLIEVRPQRGTYVARISLQAVQRARFVRSALELAIIREAAEHGVPEAALEEARRAIAGQENARLRIQRYSRVRTICSIAPLPMASGMATSGRL